MYLIFIFKHTTLWNRSRKMYSPMRRKNRETITQALSSVRLLLLLIPRKPILVKQITNLTAVYCDVTLVYTPVLYSNN